VSIRYGIIGGTGLARFAELADSRRRVFRTPYGDPSCALTFGRLDGGEVVFLARHGYGHHFAPHEINYRANLYALREAAVDAIVAVAAVGGIAADCTTGSIVIPDQLIDYTCSRRMTFFEGGDQPVTHIDFTHPYDRLLRCKLIAAARSCDQPVRDFGVYGCTQGPRLETAAEIARMRRDGCDLVGMTGMPEAALARELGIPYATAAVVANPAAGLGSSSEGVSIDQITKVLEAAMARVRNVLGALIKAP
jgi:5'-methylthioinosine phosphorylase